MVRKYNLLFNFCFRDTLTAYRWCRTAACLFDLPYKRVLRLRGPLAAISHVIVSKPSVDTLRDFEISYACVLDSAGQILDDGWVVRLSHEQVQLVLSGYHFDSLTTFLGLWISKLP